MSTDVVPIEHETGVSVRQEFGSTEIMRGAETAMAAMAAQSKALVEARFVVAMRNPRRWANIRISVNNLCKDPGFAAEALYVKPLNLGILIWPNPYQPVWFHYSFQLGMMLKVSDSIYFRAEIGSYALRAGIGIAL